MNEIRDEIPRNYFNDPTNAATPLPEGRGGTGWAGSSADMDAAVAAYGGPNPIEATDDTELLRVLEAIDRGVDELSNKAILS